MRHMQEYIEQSGDCARLSSPWSPVGTSVFGLALIAGPVRSGRDNTGSKCAAYIFMPAAGLKAVQVSHLLFGAPTRIGGRQPCATVLTAR